jgi:hypothetical protein
VNPSSIRARSSISARATTEPFGLSYKSFVERQDHPDAASARARIVRGRDRHHFKLAQRGKSVEVASACRSDENLGER